MGKFFAAARRASKNHLVLRLFFILRRQVIDTYQVLQVDSMCAAQVAPGRRRQDCGNRPRCSIVAWVGSSACEFGFTRAAGK
jgi:hypothetical protein